MKGYADLDGKRYDIRAQIHTIDDYSVNADQMGLVNFVTRMRKWPSELRTVHGQPGGKGSFQCNTCSLPKKGRYVETVIQFLRADRCTYP